MDTHDEREEITLKSAAIAFVSILMLVSVGLIIVRMDNRSIRENGLEHNVAIALEQTMENLKVDKKYDIHTEAGIDEWVADFIQSLLVSMDNNSEIKVNVLKADPEKGLLDVECVERYSGVNRSVKEISCRKTIIFDEWENPESIYHNVKFSVGDTIVQTINIHHGDLLESVQSVIKSPNEEGKTFNGWRMKSTGTIYSDFTGTGIIVDSDDLEFEAVFF